MNFEAYKTAAMRTSGHRSTGEMLLMGALGAAGEAGEIADIVKKVVFHGHPLDEKQLKKEVGDVLWYLASICDCHGWNMDEVAQMNLDKLYARYPDGFSSEASLNRTE